MSVGPGRNKVEQGSCLALLRLVEAYSGSLKGLPRRTRKAAADLGGHTWSLDTAKGIPQRIVLQLGNQQAPCACVVASKLVGKHMLIAQQHSVRKPRTGLHTRASYVPASVAVRPFRCSSSWHFLLQMPDFVGMRRPYCFRVSRKGRVRLSVKKKKRKKKIK